MRLGLIIGWILGLFLPIATLAAMAVSTNPPFYWVFLMCIFALLFGTVEFAFVYLLTFDKDKLRELKENLKKTL